MDALEPDETALTCHHYGFRNNGQTCVCANRFYIHDSVYNAFAQKLNEAVNRLRVGNGFEDGVTIGPLIDSTAVTKIQSHIDDAIAKGAKILAGGKAHLLGAGFGRRSAPAARF